MKLFLFKILTERRKTLIYEFLVFVGHLIKNGKQQSLSSQSSSTWSLRWWTTPRKGVSPSAGEEGNAFCNL